MTSPTPETPRTPLQELIQSRLDEFGWTAGTVSRRAGLRDNGSPRLPRATVYRYVKQPLQRSLSEPLMEALADGLSVSLTTVRNAVGRSLQIVRDGDGGARAARWRDLLDRVAELPDDVQDRLIWTVERLVIGAGAAARTQPVSDMANVGEVAEFIHDRFDAMTDEQRSGLLAQLNSAEQSYRGQQDHKGSLDPI